jgi:probable F420-dependent oxidoreductase
MKIGISLPHIGKVASAEGVEAVAQRAEELGYDSVWVLERTLWPVNPMNPYPATSDGMLPDEYRIVFDPVTTLTFAAAKTRRVKLGTSVIVISNHNPLILGRQLATLDVLSRGRLICGLGVGWSKDEILAAGVPYDRRGARADEFVRALKMIWSEDPVEFSGEFFKIPRSFIGPKPVQKPHPPIIFRRFVGETFERVVQLANGWNPISGIPLDDLKETIAGLRKAAKSSGKNPRDFEIFLRTFQILTEKEYRQYEDIGVTHVILDLNFGAKSLDTILKQMETIRA